MAATGHKEIFDFASDDGAVWNVVRLGLIPTATGVGGADCGSVRMAIHVPAAGRDRVIESTPMANIIFAQYVLPDDPPRLTDSDIGTARSMRRNRAVPRP